MFETLEKIGARPEPFSCYTAHALWADAHTAKSMLAFHLDEAIDVSSRRAEFIDRSVAWIAETFHIGPKTQIADFGCGPGLYAARLAQRQAQVTGIDFSESSILHAGAAAAEKQLAIQYIHQNYLEFDTDDRFDLIIMIMCDFCALSPEQRRTLLNKFHTFLKPAGRILLDVYSLNAFAQRQEITTYQENLLDGFWSPQKYFGFQNTFKYEKEKVVLDKYTIVEQERTRTVYNWLQYFSPEALEREFEKCGLAVESRHADVAGTPFDSGAGEFAVVAKKI